MVVFDHAQTGKLKSATQLSIVTPSHKSVKLLAKEESAIMMGKLARFVLVFYTLLMFKPVMPVWEDAFAHTFFLQQHMLQVHEVNGKFHIHQELASAGHLSDNEKPVEITVSIDEYFNIIPEVFKILLTSHTIGTYLSYAFHYPICTFSDIHYPPPQSGTLSMISGVTCDGNWFQARY